MADTELRRGEEFVADTLATFGPDRDDVKREATLEELDIDSLDVVELSQAVEDEFGIGLKPESFEGSSTVGDLMDVVIRAVEAA